MKKTFTRFTKHGFVFNVLDLPGTDLFKFEIVNKKGAYIEKIVEDSIGKKVYGISHLVEHLSFKSTLDYTTEEINDILRNNGDSNATTTHHSIDYYFKTISKNARLAIKVMLNIALNDLRKITDKDFKAEKSIVSNEVLGYLDDSQASFYRSANTCISNYHDEHNVTGVFDTIQTFEIDDVIYIKNHFLEKKDFEFNITYDSTRDTSIDDILNYIITQTKRFSFKESDDEFNMLYNNNIGEFNKGNFILNSTSSRRMNYILFDILEDTYLGDYVLDYLNVKAGLTSIDDVLREQNELVYSAGIYHTIFKKRGFALFICDIEIGNEKILMESLIESINKTADEFDLAKYDKYMSSIQIDRIIDNVNQNSYNDLFDFAIWDTDTFSDFEELFMNDIDKAFVIMDEISLSFENMKESLETIKLAINEKSYAMVTN